VAGAPEALEAVDPPGVLEVVEPPDEIERAEAAEPAVEVPSAAGANLELEAFAAATGESGGAALEIFVAVVAEPADTGPDAFAATAA
jgi:hypothetical protein